jgi:predicted DNA-binding transcriptional regulator YafY
MSQLARELFMLQYLDDHRNRYVKNQELADILEVSQREIRRYREDLQDGLRGTTIEHKVGKYGGYCLTGKTINIHSISETEAIMINLASRSSASYMRCLNEAFQIQKKMRENLVNGANALPFPNLQLMVEITKAINRRKKISFHYSINNKECEIKISPYLFCIEHGLYYLRGLYVAKSGQSFMRTYDVKEIKKLKVAEESFVLDEGLNAKELENAKCFGVWRDSGEPQEICLEVLDSEADVNQFFDYKGKYKDNLFFIRCFNEYEAMKTILSLGRKVRIVTPESLKTKLLYELDKIKHNY